MNLRPESSDGDFVINVRITRLSARPNGCVIATIAGIIEEQGGRLLSYGTPDHLQQDEEGAFRVEYSRPDGKIDAQTATHIAEILAGAVTGTIGSFSHLPLAEARTMESLAPQIPKPVDESNA